MFHRKPFPLRSNVSGEHYVNSFMNAFGIKRNKSNKGIKAKKRNCIKAKE